MSDLRKESPGGMKSTTNNDSDNGAGYIQANETAINRTTAHNDSSVISAEQIEEDVINQAGNTKIPEPSLDIPFG